MYRDNPSIKFRRISVTDAILFLLLLGFLGLSGYATFVGIHDIIAAERPGLTEGQNWYYIASAVFVLSVAMLVALEIALKRGNWAKRLLALLMYLMLAIWSVGFGYGFWWKILASRSATQDSITSVMSQVSQQAGQAKRSVETIAARLDSLRAEAVSKQDIELDRGGSCGTDSPRGDGPLAKARKELTEKIGILADEVRKMWISPLQNEVAKLEKIRSQFSDPDSLKRLTTAERVKRFTSIQMKSSDIVASIQSINRQQGAIWAPRFRDLAQSLDVIPSKTVCSDVDLAKILRDMASFEQQEQSFSRVSFDITEGPAATVYAFHRIWSKVFWMMATAGNTIGLSLPPAQVDALERRDVIALIAAIAIDFCLLSIAAIRAHRAFNVHSRYSPRGKLIQAIKAFRFDGEADMHSIFNTSIMRYGSEHYLIMPMLSPLISNARIHYVIYIRNILLVLEEIDVIRSHHRATGLNALFKRLSCRSMDHMFYQAAKQLKRFGWVDSMTLDAENKKNVLARFAIEEISLYKLRRGDLLEILLLMHDESGPLGQAKSAVNDEEATNERVYKTDSHYSEKEYLPWFSSWMKSLAGYKQLFNRSNVSTSPSQSTNDQRNFQSSSDDSSEESRNLINDPQTIAKPNTQSHDSQKTSKNPVRFRDWLSKSPSDSVQNNEKHQVSRINEENIDQIQPVSENTNDMEKLFDIIDDMRRAFAMGYPYESTGIDIKQVHENTHQTKLVLDELEKTLLYNGIVPTARENALSNPNIHEQIYSEKSDTPIGTILKIHKQGYKNMKSGKILRIAQVVVSSGENMPEQGSALDKLN